MSAALVNLKTENPNNWVKGKEILDRLHKEKSPFAASLLAAYHTLPKFGKVDFQKAKDYNTDALAWDNKVLWNNYPIETFIKKGAIQMLQPEEKK